MGKREEQVERESNMWWVERKRERERLNILSQFFQPEGKIEKMVAENG